MMMMLTFQKANLWSIRPMPVLLDYDLTEFTSTTAEHESSSTKVIPSGHVVTITVICIHIYVYSIDLDVLPSNNHSYWRCTYNL